MLFSCVWVCWFVDTFSMFGLFCLGNSRRYNFIIIFTCFICLFLFSKFNLICLCLCLCVCALSWSISFSNYYERFKYIRFSFVFFLLLVVFSNFCIYCIPCFNVLFIFIFHSGGMSESVWFKLHAFLFCIVLFSFIYGGSQKHLFTVASKRKFSFCFVFIDKNCYLFRNRERFGLHMCVCECVSVSLW